MILHNFQRALAAALFTAGFGFPALAQPIALKAARMFDGQKITAPGVVVSSGSTILAVGKDAPAPAGARAIDFDDATLSPGFIDAHTHLSAMYSTDYRQSALDELQKTIPERTLLAMENLKKTLV